MLLFFMFLAEVVGRVTTLGNNIKLRRLRQPAGLLHTLYFNLARWLSFLESFGVEMARSVVDRANDFV